MDKQYVVEIHSEEDWRRVAEILEKAGYLWASHSPIQGVTPYIPGKIYLFLNKTVQKSGLGLCYSAFVKISIDMLPNAVGLRWIQEDI